MNRDDIARKYEEIAPFYRNNGWFDSYILGLHWKRKKLFRYLSGKILDVACGTGENFPYFSQCASYTAIDYSPTMLNFARQRTQNLGLNIQLQRMDAEHLEFEDNAFDTVISTMSTCTFPDPVGALREMGRVSKGQIILIEHGRSRVGWIARYQDRNAHRHFESAGCRWNQQPVELVRAAGLKIHSVERSFFGVVSTIIAEME